jgi:hypothetical protein
MDTLLITVDSRLTETRLYELPNIRNECERCTFPIIRNGKTSIIRNINFLLPLSNKINYVISQLQ